MNKLFGLFLLALAFLAPARSEAAGCIIGGGILCKNAALSYTGPGDLVTFQTWWGLRAYSAAKAGTRTANICNNADVNCADVNSLANGDFDVATAQGAPLSCGGGGGTCTVKILYDQTGNNSCTGAVACDMAEGVINNRPRLDFNCFAGTKACMLFASASSQALITSATIAITYNQPYTISSVFNLPTTSDQAITSANSAGTGYFLTIRTASPTIEMSAGTAFAVSYTGGTSMAVQSVANGASSVLYLNGTSNPGSAGAQSPPSTGNYRMGNNSFSQFANGRVGELGYATLGMNGTQQSNVNSNQRTYYGF